MRAPRRRERQYPAPMGHVATARARRAHQRGSLLFVTLFMTLFAGASPPLVDAGLVRAQAPVADTERSEEADATPVAEADATWGAPGPADDTGDEAAAPELAADDQARAAAPPPTPPERRHVFPIGIDVGWRGDGRRNAAVLGGELSIVWFTPERSMFGGPADGSTGFGLVFGAVWVSRPNHFRGSVGFEVMRFFSEGLVAGIDASATFHTRGDPVGFRTRAFMGGYGIMLYAGLDYHGRPGGEAGAMVKFPLGG